MEPIWSSYQLFLSHQNEEIRLWTFKRLQLAAPKEAVRIARSWLQGPSTALTEYAARVIEELSLPEDEPLIRARLTEKPSPGEALNLVAALARFVGGKAFREYLAPSSGVELPRWPALWRKLGRF